MKYEGSLLQTNIASKILSNIPSDIAQKYKLIPLALENKVLTVVTSDVNNFQDEYQLLDIIKNFNSSIDKIQLLLTSEMNFRTGFEKFYKVELKAEDLSLEKEKSTSLQIEKVNKIIKTALEYGASDIHIFPLEKECKIALRINGRIKIFDESDFKFDKSESIQITNVIKNKAGMDIGNRNIPQDGSFTEFGVDFRGSTVPTVFGEKTVLRIFDSNKQLKKLSEIGFNQSDEQLLQDICQRPSGIILMTGPTGEGKTTTLYACLREINPFEKVIFSLENPVEQKIPGVCQVQIHEVENNKKANLDWTVGIKAALRQDPDVLLLGEIRDEATAKAAVQASQSGHLIFSTLHTSGAIESVERMVNLGVHRKSFLGQVICILAQRLLEKLCPYCKKEITLNPDIIKKLRPADLEKLKDKKIYSSPGCQKCLNTGVISRIPVFEVIVFNNKIRDFFSKERGLIETEIFLRKENYRSLWDKGLDLVLSGEVSIENLLYKIKVDDDLEEMHEYLKNKY